MLTVPRLLRVSILSAAALVSVAACGEDPPQTAEDVCDRIVKAECNRIYECIGQAGREQYGVYGPPAQCIVDQANKAQCQSATEEKVCPGPNPYGRPQAEACINEINAANCSQVQANGTRVAAYAPSCAQCFPSMPETPTQVCTRVVTAECNKLYACTTEAIRAQVLGLTGPVETCIANVSAQVQCPAATETMICAGASPYSRTQAEACITEANAATCAQVIANAANITAYAPSCSQCVPKFM